jgi:hypothetical protein
LWLCVSAAGCGDDLAMKDQNRIYRAFGGVAYACTPGVKPTHWQIRQARAGVRAIVAQYRETSDGRAQIGEGSRRHPIDAGHPSRCRWQLSARGGRLRAHPPHRRQGPARVGLSRGLLGLALGLDPHHVPDEPEAL